MDRREDLEDDDAIVGEERDSVYFNKGSLQLQLIRNESGVTLYLVDDVGSVWAAMDNVGGFVEEVELRIPESMLGTYADSFDIASKALRIWKKKHGNKKEKV